MTLFNHKETHAGGRSEIDSRLRALSVAMAGGYGALQWLGRTYGSTHAERHRVLPGDDLCRRPLVVTTHATTINAPPSAVWPWLVQMGWGRGQWYTSRWVDLLLFPHNGPSADRIIPELQDLQVGDRILDGPPETKTGFTVEALMPEHHLVLRSTEHLPPGWAERFGATINFTWAFVLDDVGAGRTRFIFRSRGRVAPPWVAALYVALLVPADFVMSRQMLRGVRSRVEHALMVEGAGRPVRTPRGPHSKRSPIGFPRADRRRAGHTGIRGSSAVIDDPDRVCSSRPTSDDAFARRAPGMLDLSTMSACFQRAVVATKDIGLTDESGNAIELMGRRPCTRRLPVSDRPIHRG